MANTFKMVKSNIHSLGITALTVVVALCITIVTLPNHTDAQVPPAVAPAGNSLEQRIAQRKAERNVVIIEMDKPRLIEGCSSAQTKVRSLQQKTTPIVLERAKSNQQVDAKLWVTIGKLKLAQKDTFTLEKQRVTLAEKVAFFAQTEQQYQQTLDDTIVINCKADLQGFKSLLDTARIYRTQLRDQSTDIRNYVINDIKPTITGFSTELQGGEAAAKATEGQQ
ncbi:MAG: hypothetical protein ACR2FM_04380 [Candidatus Saccharimonadales bacterium]